MTTHTDFIPHTDAEVAEMLSVIGVPTIDDLFNTVPAELRNPDVQLSRQLSEPEVVDHLTELAAKNSPSAGGHCFAGGGMYDHYVPAIVRAMAMRGEFATAYTPYQAEASQGTLQYLFEFQTMIAELFGLAASNASLYDAATGMVEAVNVATSASDGTRVLVSSGVNPRYVNVLRTYAPGLGLEVVTLGTRPDGGTDLRATDLDGAAAIVIQHPDRHGYLEQVDGIKSVAGETPIVAVCDPVSLGALKPPGEWGADLAIAEGQALGLPMAWGGQCVGLFGCSDRFVRHMPGRLVGETVDAEGQRGYVLTLQAREQHIKRAKARSNICTNQSLFALMTTIHLSWLGPAGLKHVATVSAQKAHAACELIESRTAFRRTSDRPYLREFAITGPVTGPDLVSELSARGITVGPADNDGHVNLAFTERRTAEQINDLVSALEEIGGAK